MWMIWAIGIGCIYMFLVHPYVEQIDHKLEMDSLVRKIKARQKQEADNER